MPVARYWSREMDEVILQGCKIPGKTWEAMARELAAKFPDIKMNRTAVIHRGQKLRVRPMRTHSGGRLMNDHPQLAKREGAALEDEAGKSGVNRLPLKAGHPATWELLVGKGRPYPPPELTLLSKKMPD